MNGHVSMSNWDTCLIKDACMQTDIHGHQDDAISMQKSVCLISNEADEIGVGGNLKLYLCTFT